MEKKNDKVAMTVWIDRSLAERASELAKMADLSRSKICGNILEMGIEELVRCQKVGVFQLSLLIRDMHEGLKGWANSLLSGEVVPGTSAGLYNTETGLTQSE